jgi:hypothetical protein
MRRHSHGKVLIFPLGIAITISIANHPNREIALTPATSSQLGTLAGSIDKGYKLTV